MKKEIIYTIIAGLILFAGCIQSSSDQNNKANDKAILDLYARFPELPRNKANPTSFYKFVRSVKNGLRNFEVQLYSTPQQKDKDNQEIIIIINNLGKRYAIPFLSNENKSYWNFQFENINQSVDLTFNKELLRALNSLQFNDTIGTAQVVIFEIFNSLLHLRSFNKCEIGESKPYKLIEVPDETNHPDWYSCEDSCSARIKQVNSSILESFDLPKKKYHSNPVFIDFRRKRIYQFDYPQFKKIDTLNLSVYRIGCECQYIGISL
jgi:hypothetical protein